MGSNVRFVTIGLPDKDVGGKAVADKPAFQAGTNARHSGRTVSARRLRMDFPALLSQFATAVETNNGDALADCFTQTGVDRKSVV